MAFFDRMKDSLTTAGQEVTQKAKNATENVRLTNQIKNNDKMVEKLLYQVGLKYYEAHSQEEGTEYQELFSEIRRLKEENEKYQQELNALTAMKKCPQCGFSNNAGAKFCISCGAPLNQAPAAPVQTAAGKCCDKCGALNDAEALFCTECGNRLNTQPAEPEVKKQMVYEVPEVKSTEPVTESGAEETENSADEQKATIEETNEPARCAKCGALLEKDALFCTSCGARIE